MSTYETLLTPATCAASDDGKIMSPEGARNRGRWGGGLRKHSSKRHLNASSGGPKVGKVVADKAEKRPEASNVIKRAVHKISKKTRRHSTTPSKPPPSTVIDAAPPKVGAGGRKSVFHAILQFCDGS